MDNRPRDYAHKIVPRVAEFVNAELEREGCPEEFKVQAKTMIYSSLHIRFEQKKAKSEQS